MWKVQTESFDKGQEIVGEAETFVDAIKIGQEKVCMDLFHEGSVSQVGHSYWFSDEDDANKSYKVKITNETPQLTR